MPRFVLEPEISTAEVLTGLGEGFVLAPGERTRQRVTYLDTFDWRLDAAGLTLTASPHGRGIRLVLMADDGRGWEVREPQTPSFAGDLAMSPLREAVEEASGIRRLLPRAHARWEEERISLLNEDHKTVVRVRLRRGDARLPASREPAALPSQLHLDLLKGYEAEFKKALFLVRKAFRRKPREGGELAMVLGALGRSPGDYSSTFRLELDPQLGAGEALRTIHRCLLDTMEANQEGMIKDLDSEFLHDFRVAVRRTRSALAQVPGVLPEPVLLRFSEEFRWLGERTGPTRDMDVYLLKIPAYQRALPEGVRDQLEPLVRFLKQKKRREHRRMVRSLGSKRYVRLVEEWRAFLQAPAEADPELPNAARPIRLVAEEQIWKVYRKVLKRGRKTDRRTSPETLHRLRIDCKRLRYLMTFFQSLFPAKALKPLIKELKNLQDNLGDFNDLYVQRAALLGFAGEMLASGKAPPATLMAMGQLMGQLEARQTVEGEAFRARFQKFAREKNQKRFRRLFGPTQAGGEGEAPRQVPPGNAADPESLPPGNESARPHHKPDQPHDSEVPPGNADSLNEPATPEHEPGPPGDPAADSNAPGTPSEDPGP